MPRSKLERALSHVGAVQEVRQQDEERGVLFLLRGGVLRTQVHGVEEALAAVCAVVEAHVALFRGHMR